MISCIFPLTKSIPETSRFRQYQQQEIPITTTISFPVIFEAPPQIDALTKLILKAGIFHLRVLPLPLEDRESSTSKGRPFH